MHEENTVSLKVYLMEGKNNIEVRRFEVDQGVITNYDYVRERLQVAIPSLRDKVFKLLWQDAEEDEVTISSDEELMIALSELKANVLKFIVRLPSNESENETYMNFNIPNIQDIFSHVTNFTNLCPLFGDMQGDVNCSSCKQPISGIRYKCLECVQYCHCAECECKKLHPDHVMLRLTKNTSLNTLIPKCYQIFKSHLIRGAGKCAGMNTFFRDRMSHCPAMNKDSCNTEKEKYNDKEKCGSRHHHRRFRRHGYCDKSSAASKQATQTEEAMQTECPFNEQMLGNLGNYGNLIETFLGMYKDASQKSQPEENRGETASSSGTKSSPIKTVHSDGPPMPVDASMQEDNATAGSSADSQKGYCDI